MKRNWKTKKAILEGFETFKEHLFINLYFLMEIILIFSAFLLFNLFYNYLNKPDNFIDTLISFFPDFIFFIILFILLIFLVSVFLINFIKKIYLYCKHYELFVLPSFLASFALAVYIIYFIQDDKSFKAFLDDVKWWFSVHLNLYFILFFLVLILIVALFSVKKRKNKIKPIFISDKAVGEDDNELNDELGIKKDAETFAENVLNNGHPDSMAFGLDSPWGSGKTSYVAFCREYWKNHKLKPLLLNFQPLIYEGQEDLFCKFVEELVTIIKNETYVLGLNSVFRRYLRKIKEIKINLGFLGGISLGGGNENYEKILEELKELLEKLNKKVIIVIDDLDRLDIKDVKIMLNIVRNVFRLPNISFLLCYDTENINSFDVRLKKRKTKEFVDLEADKNKQNKTLIQFEELNNKKIIEYFEKIVQVKKVLLPRSKVLKKFFVKNIKKAFLEEEGKTLDYEKYDSLRRSIDYFFSSEKFIFYRRYIGDIRKIKRVVNSFKERNLLGKFDKKYDFYNSDIDIRELMKLIFVYINYPKIFSDIFYAEVDTKKPFFSVSPIIYDLEKEKEGALYENTKYYKEYKKELTKDERELLDDIFNIELEGDEEKRLLEQLKDEDFKSRTPMFNGAGGLNLNLRDYLKLIVEKDNLSMKNHFRVTLEDVKEKDISVLNKYKDEFFLVNYFKNLNNKFFFKKDSKFIKINFIRDMINYLINNLDKLF